MDKNFNVTINLHSHGDVAGESRIIHLWEKIMSAISDFADKMKTHNDAVDKAVEGLTQDVKTLNDKITALQTSQGSVTPEDQALLDAIEARGQSISDKLTALDALTPPPAPPSA
jgi:regulator of sigma D